MRQEVVQQLGLSRPGPLSLRAVGMAPVRPAVHPAHQRQGRTPRPGHAPRAEFATPCATSAYHQAALALWLATTCTALR